MNLYLHNPTSEAMRIFCKGVCFRLLAKKMRLIFKRTCCIFKKMRLILKRTCCIFKKMRLIFKRTCTFVFSKILLAVRLIRSYLTWSILSCWKWLLSCLKGRVINAVLNNCRIIDQNNNWSQLSFSESY